MKILKKLLIPIIMLLLVFSKIEKIQAANASISVSSSTSKIVVGNTFTVTIKISSSSPLGSWEFTPSYNSSMLSLISGETPIADSAENGSTKSKSYTYKFKALKTGTANVSVKSYGAYSWNEERLSVSAGSKNISIITQAQLEASYSKNNYLKSLTVEGLKLSPEFNKNTTEYTVEAEPNTTNITIKATSDDSKSSISGTGIKEVSEGENKFNITVTAENGSIKTYTIIVNVIDPNPIKVNVDNVEYTVIKRETLLECPENFEKVEVTINNQTIPGYYSKINNITIIGLKDTEANIKYFIYDKEKNEYSEYNEVTLQQIKIFPLEIDKKFDKIYEKTKTTINGTIFESMKIKNSDYSIIHAKNILTGEKNYYLYDSILNTITRYTDENLKPLKNKINTQNKLIIILGIETVLVIIVLISLLISKAIKNKKIKSKSIEEIKETIDEKNNIEENTVEKDNKEDIEENNIQEEIDEKIEKPFKEKKTRKRKKDITEEKEEITNLIKEVKIEEKKTRKKRS